jgi:hypothetical protein
MDIRQADLASLITEANLIADDAKNTFGQLTVSQLNWKPSADRWSVAQCFDHLLTTNKGYIPIIKSVLAGKKTHAVGAYASASRTGREVAD